MNVLVLGDRIFDQYTFCKATRLCPEAPAPVLIMEKQRTSVGGAGLVAEQLKVLFSDKQVREFCGSVSDKHRIFAERQLVCRVDRDSHSILGKENYWRQIKHMVETYSYDGVVVGDYNKGAMTGIGEDLTKLCKEKDIPLFVDVKHDPKPYLGCFAIFPNELEHNGIHTGDYQHIIRKLGPRGCSVDGIFARTEEQQVYDVTGAGDIFMAAFVFKYLTDMAGHLTQQPLMTAAHFANKVAGISVRHLGTYVVPLEDIHG